MAIQLKQFSYVGKTDGPHLLITGGVHGDEFEPIAAIRRLRDLFETDPEILAGLRWRVTLVPIVNEAAFLRGHRSAEDGLDLARSCPGDPNGSPTEQAANALSELIRAADYYIDLHTGGTEYAVWPMAGYVLHADANILNIQRRMAKAFNLPVVWGTAPNLQGRSLSVARDANVPAIYCEYLGSANCEPAGVDAYVAGCLNVMAELKLINRPAPKPLIEYTIEDPAPSSGHMQIQNPSPVAGYFEPAVRLGTLIETGQPLGTVYDIEKHQPHEVIARQDGLVLVLRTFPRVAKGESVGVIANKNAT